MKQNLLAPNLVISCQNFNVSLFVRQQLRIQKPGGSILAASHLQRMLKTEGTATLLKTRQQHHSIGEILVKPIYVLKPYYTNDEMSK